MYCVKWRPSVIAAYQHGFSVIHSTGSAEMWSTATMFTTVVNLISTPLITWLLSLAEQWYMTASKEPDRKHWVDSSADPLVQLMRTFLSKVAIGGPWSTFLWENLYWEIKLKLSVLIAILTNLIINLFSKKELFLSHFIFTEFVMSPSFFHIV